MSAISDLLAANLRYAASFDKSGLPKEPRRRLAVLTCMDARLVPSAFLGLAEGDAHVIANAGGRVTDDVLRSLIISIRLLGTREILVVHHTDCGAMHLDNEELRARLRRETGADASGIDFLPFRDLDGSVREDVALLRRSPLIGADVTVRGFVYDVETGLLREVG